MKRVTFCLLLTVGLSTSAFCQMEEKMKLEYVVPGAIIQDGKEIPGYIKKMGTATASTDVKNTVVYPAPWQYQSTFKFIPKEVFENTNKIKPKMYVKYTPKDCSGYKYDTLVFESVKYSDMSSVGVNMFPTKMFMRKLSDDKISLFLFFESPPAVGIYGPGEYEKILVDCAKEKVVYRIGKEGKLKEVGVLNIEKEMSDCPMVVEKQAKGEYKVLGKEGKGTRLGKLLGNTVFRDDTRLMAIADYNTNCK